MLFGFPYQQLLVFPTRTRFTVIAGERPPHDTAVNDKYQTAFPAVANGDIDVTGQLLGTHLADKTSKIGEFRAEIFVYFLS